MASTKRREDDLMREEARRAKAERRRKLLAQLAGKTLPTEGQLGDEGAAKKRVFIIRRSRDDEESDGVDDTWGTSSGDENDREKSDLEEDGPDDKKNESEERVIDGGGKETDGHNKEQTGGAQAELLISANRVESGKVEETSEASMLVPPAADAPSPGPSHDEGKRTKLPKKEKERKKALARSSEEEGGKAVDKRYSDESIHQFSVSASAVPLLHPMPMLATLASSSFPLSADGAKRQKKSKKEKKMKKKDKSHSTDSAAVLEEEGEQSPKEKEKKKKSKKKSKSSIAGTTTIDHHVGVVKAKSRSTNSLSNSPSPSPPSSRPSSSYAAAGSLPSSASSSPSSSRPSSRPSSAYACSSPLAIPASASLSLSLSAVELASVSTALPPLTDHCALAVLRYLRPGELCRAALVAKSWHRLAFEDSLWRGFLTHKIRQRRDPALGGSRQHFKLAWRRSKVATEILTTEQSYVASLRRVVELFIVPLRDKANEQVITAEERKALFSEVELILGLNSSLLKDLEERMAQWSFDQCLGDIFKQFTSFLKVYTSYINNFDNSITTLAKLKQSNENFSAYLSYAESRKECNGLLINAFLVMPVQRIPRYVLLLKDFLRNTPEDHDDHGNVSKALSDMQQVAAYIEKKKEEAENIYHIMAIQDSLEGKFSTIVVPGRKYKFEGPLSEAVMSSKRTKRKTEGFYCFLFNDLFVVAKRKGLISHIKKITAKRLRPGSKGSTWNNTGLYSAPFGSSSSASESAEGVRFDFVKQIPISAATTTIDRVSADEAAELGMEVDLCFKILSAEDESDEPPIFAAPNEKELHRWLQAFEGCISSMTPRSAEAYIRIERSRSVSEETTTKKRNSASFGNAKKPSFLKRMSVGPGTSTSLNIITPPHSPATAHAPSADRKAALSCSSEAPSSSSSASGPDSTKKKKKDKKLKASS